MSIEMNNTIEIEDVLRWLKNKIDANKQAVGWATDKEWATTYFAGANDALEEFAVQFEIVGQYGELV